MTGTINTQATALPSLENRTQTVITNQEKSNRWLFEVGHGTVMAVHFHLTAYATLQAAVKGQVRDAITYGAQALLTPTLVGLLNYTANDPKHPKGWSSAVDTITMSWLLSLCAVTTLSCLKAAHDDWIAQPPAQPRGLRQHG